MTTKIEDMYLQRQVANTLAAGAMYRPLDLGEILIIENWICDQRNATSPDIASWELLWNNRGPFFALELAALIGQDIYDNIRYGAEPVTVPETGLEQWDKIDQRFRILLGCMGRNDVDIYDAKYPVLIRRANPLEAWRIGPERTFDVKDKDEEEAAIPLSTLVFVDSSDVLNVLLRTWIAQRPKFMLARERLCDLIANCVTKARADVTPSP
ncbi:MAG: hypothetical protein ACYC44_01375 [Patescibacteria group bacterium]